MATKQFNSRIQWKKDTSANWTANNPVLLNGEIAIVITNSGETRFKVGDGTSSYTALPFQDEFLQAAITEVDDALLTHETDTGNPHAVTKSQVGLGNVDNVKQYSASNPPPYPVTSVNGETGNVNLTAADVGALSTAGGTLTGNLTGRYLTGTWLQSTAVTNYNSSSYKGICIFDSSGWVYYRTPAQILSDIGATAASPFNTSYSGTLASGSGNWTSSSGQYYQQFDLPEITSTQTPLVFPQWTTNITNEQTAWNSLLNIQAFDGYIRFYASAPTATNVNFILLYTNYSGGGLVELVKNGSGTVGTFTPI